MNSQHKANILLALQTLAGQCDGAHQKDSVSFSANHATLGAQLAGITSLTDDQAIEGFEIVKHYSKQLGDLHSTIMAESVERSMEDEPQAPASASASPAQSSGGMAPGGAITPTAIPGISLTAEQENAFNLIVAWIDDSPNDEYKQGGYAGTGKTTLVKFLINELSKRYNIVVCAFTGKAVNVLQRKGIPARTMHSLLYDAVIEPKSGDVTFERKVCLEDDPDLIVIDEASMVSTELYSELKHWGKKLLFVGDPGQLEPVGDNPNLMKSPDFVLQHIHRQAAESPIIALANSIRTGGQLTFGERPGLVVRRKAITGQEFFSCDQIIVAKNQTRKDFNSRARRFLGYPDRKIVVGDKLICLRNNITLGVYNGMILRIKEIKNFNGFQYNVLAEDELGIARTYPIWAEPFSDPTFDEKKARVPKTVVYADFGYAITCHKSQGSEWRKVLVWREWMPPQIWDQKRWDYTAITRASHELIFNV